jgi:hypothetical protein
MKMYRTRNEHRYIHGEWSPRKTKLPFLFVISALLGFFFGTYDLGARTHLSAVLSIRQDALVRLRPRVPADAYRYSILRTGVFEVAKVFGRVKGCQDVDSEFIEDVNRAATHVALDPRIFASTIANESGCNPFAVSNRGAIGLTQVVPAAHKTEYDFEKTNLFNRQDNLKVGAEILAKNIRQFGTTSGVARYQGLASTCDDAHHCNPNYTNAVIGLAKGVSLPAQNSPNQGVSLQPSSPTPQP